MKWPWKRTPPPTQTDTLLALARAALDCRESFEDMSFTVSIGPNSGFVTVVIVLPCGKIESADFTAKYHTSAMVPTAMGLLLARARAHMRGCPASPLDIGEFEIEVPRGTQ